MSSFLIISLFIFLFMYQSHGAQKEITLRALAQSLNITCAPIKKNPGDLCGALINAQYTTGDEDFAPTGIGYTRIYGYTEYVMKYKTQIRDGSVIDATGVVWIPTTDIPPPPGGFPVLLYGHGTVSANDTFAPSDTLSNPNSYTELEESLLRYVTAFGFIVVMPDYSGLGVAGIPHYYLVKKPTAYSVIDGVRSAILLAKQCGLAVSRNTVFLGHSQGGGAVLYAQELYDGPERYGKCSFHLKAVVSLAPAPIFRYAIYALAIGYTQASAAQFALYLWAAVQYNHELQLSDVLSDASIEAITTYAESGLVDDLINANLFPMNATEFAVPSAQEAALVNLNGLNCYLGLDSCQGGLPPLDLNNMLLTGLSNQWQAQLDEDGPGYTLCSSVPVRLVQGSQDKIVNPLFTIMLAQRMATNGVHLVDKYGNPFDFSNTKGLSNLQRELLRVSNCTTDDNALFVLCGKNHGDVLMAYEEYLGFIFSKAFERSPLLKKGETGKAKKGKKGDN